MDNNSSWVYKYSLYSILYIRCSAWIKALPYHICVISKFCEHKCSREIWEARSFARSKKFDFQKIGPERQAFVVHIFTNLKHVKVSKSLHSCRKLMHQIQIYFPLKNDSSATKKGILLQITLFGNLSFAFEIFRKWKRKFYHLCYSTVFIKSIQKMTRWHKCTQQIQFKSIIFCWPLKGFCCEQRQLATSPLSQQFASLYIV